jgi:hypothetical protein
MAKSDGPDYVTQEVFQSLVQSVSDKVAFLETITRNNVMRLETLIRLACDGTPINIDRFVNTLKTYEPFVKKLQELRAIPKISERIEAALDYNKDLKSLFVVMADDINILEQASEAESISKANFDKALTLPHTDLFKKMLSKFLDKP